MSWRELLAKRLELVKDVAMQEDKEGHAVDPDDGLIGVPGIVESNLEAGSLQKR